MSPDKRTSSCFLSPTLAVLLALLAVQSLAADSKEDTGFRLPKSVKPLHYDVTIQTMIHSNDPKDFNFKGSVRVIVECKSPTDRVILHARLSVSPSTIKFKAMEPGDSDPSYVRFEHDWQTQFYSIILSKNMQVGKRYAVAMDFTSRIYNHPRGLYYSSYKLGNDTKYLVSTQLQPIDARVVFPCMDEPALKATFNITVVRPSHLKSFSNMPIMDSSRTWREDGVDFVADVYQTTPVMSTYLLAVAVGDFDYTEDTTKSNVKFRAIARPDAKNSTLFALKAGVGFHNFFEEYFEVKDPLPKQDMLAVPKHISGGMENWGLVIYRERYMLYQPGVSDPRFGQYITTLVAHEVAHQWFGNLVTPAWWDDLWLNEGFAQYLENLAADHIRPDWKIFEILISKLHRTVFKDDGGVNSSPIYAHIAHAGEIEKRFNAITYSKSAAIIRMMRHFLGLETFRLGMKNYLNDRKYGVASHNDLWAALSNQSKADGTVLNVKDVMDTWILQMNYPVVLVKRDVNDNGKLHVSQNRFLLDRSAVDPGKYKSPFGYKWTIPLTFATSKSPNFDESTTEIHWITKEETQKSLTIGADKLPLANDKDGWILANIQQNGYYRVNYQEENWRALARQLKRDPQMIPVINRAQIVNDAWSFVKSGDLNLEIALLVIEYLKDETDDLPWFDFMREIQHMRMMLSKSPVNGSFENFLGTAAEKAYKKFKINTTQNVSYSIIDAHQLFADLACSAGNQACLTDSTQQFKQYMDNPNNNPIDPDLRKVVYCGAVRNGGWNEWQFALTRYSMESHYNHYERKRLLSALACSEDTWILNTYLEMALKNDSLISRDDAYIVISEVSGTTIGRPLAWNFIKSNYHALSTRLGGLQRRTIMQATATLNTPDEKDDLIAFMKREGNAIAYDKRTFINVVETTLENIKWMEKNYPVIEKWLLDGSQL